MSIYCLRSASELRLQGLAVSKTRNAVKCERARQFPLKNLLFAGVKRACVFCLLCFAQTQKHSHSAGKPLFVFEREARVKNFRKRAITSK